nr:unnamed protein product [Callosobruchus chinensis]
MDTGSNRKKSTVARITIHFGFRRCNH